MSKSMSRSTDFSVSNQRHRFQHQKNFDQLMILARAYDLSNKHLSRRVVEAEQAKSSKLIQAEQEAQTEHTVRLNNLCTPRFKKKRNLIRKQQLHKSSMRYCNQLSGNQRQQSKNHTSQPSRSLLIERDNCNGVDGACVKGKPDASRGEEVERGQEEIVWGKLNASLDEEDVYREEEDDLYKVEDDEDADDGVKVDEGVKKLADKEPKVNLKDHFQSTMVGNMHCLIYKYIYIATLHLNVCL